MIFAWEILALGAAGLECAEETENLLFMRALRVRGEGTQAIEVWRGSGGGVTRWEEGAVFWAIWSLWDPHLLRWYADVV